MSRSVKAVGRVDQPGEEPCQDWDSYLAALVARYSAGRGDRKQERSKRREQEILGAALRVFARDGISRARIGDIASEAGMPVSSLYDYFPSKEDLAYGLPLEHLARFFAEYAEACSELRTCRERLRLYLWLSADFARRNQHWARALYLEIWPSVFVAETPVRGALDDYVRVIIRLLKAGVDAGEWPAEPNPYITASILTGSLNQVIIVWLLYRAPRDLMKAVASVCDRTMSLLGTGTDPRTRKGARQGTRERALDR